MNNFLRQWSTVVFFGTIGINMLMGMSTMVIDWIPPDSRFILTLPLAIYALLTVLSGLDYNEHNVNPMPKECPPPPPRDPSTMRREEYPGGYTNPSPTTKPPKPSPYVAKPGHRTIVEPNSNPIPTHDIPNPPRPTRVKKHLSDDGYQKYLELLDILNDQDHEIYNDMRIALDITDNKMIELEKVMDKWKSPSFPRTITFGNVPPEKQQGSDVKTLTTVKDIHEPDTYELVGYKGSKYGWFKAHRIYTRGDGEYTDDGKVICFDENENVFNINKLEIKWDKPGIVYMAPYPPETIKGN